MAKMKPRVRLQRYEIQHLRGRRIVGSAIIIARNRMDADRKSERLRKQAGVLHYRICGPLGRHRPLHGGYHQKTWEWRNHATSLR